MKLDTLSVIGMTVKRPVTVLMLFLSTVLIGLIAQSRIPLELAPSGFVDTDITVVIPVPNSNPEEVEEQVTKPTEEILRQIAGKDQIRTSSSKDRSSITLSFGKSRDPDEAFAELRDLMEIAKLSWPEEVREYFTWRFNLDTDLPVFSFGILLDDWKADTSFLIDEKIKREIESIDGVARCQTWGVVEEAIFISIDRDKSISNGVSLFNVAQALSADNRDIIGGKVEENGSSFFLRSSGRFRDLDEIRNYPIRAGLRIGDIADVQTKQAFRDFVFRLNGKQSIWCMVNKEANANTVEVCRRIKQHLDQVITKDPRVVEEGWEWFRPELRNVGFVITSALDNLVSSAFHGGLLALLPLFYFLRRWRLVTIITLAIPASLLITLGLVYFSGGTLNILTMLGLTIATGMLVDNSIVVVESILRFRQLGYSPREAALAGSADVALANTAATTTTVVAFLPLIFMSSDANVTVITQGIGLPICFAVTASLVVAIVFIPLATVFSAANRDAENLDFNAAVQKPAGRRNFVTRLLDAGLEKVMAVNERWLSWSLRNRFASFLLLVAVTCLPAKFALDTVAQSNLTDESGGSISIDVRLEPNFTLLDANEVFKQLYDRLRSLDEGPVPLKAEEPAKGDAAKRYKGEELPPDVKMDIDYVFYRFDRTGGGLSVGLKNRSAKHTKLVVKALDQNLPKVAGAKIILRVDSQNEDKSGLKFSIYGSDVETLVRLAEDIGEDIEDLPDVQAVRNSITAGTDELVIRPDRQRMQLLGVDPRAMMGTVSWGVRGQRLPDFQAGDQNVQLYIEFAGRENTTAKSVEDMGIFTRSGRTLPLSNFADVYYTKGYGTIRKVDGRSSIELSVDTLTKDTKGLEAAINTKLAEFPFPDGYSCQSTTGLDADADRREFVLAILLAAILVYIVMAILFNHILLPLGVMVGALFALPGFLISLWVTRTPMDMVALIGGFVLVGVAVNNGIVFIDCAHRLVRGGRDRTEAMLEAARRRLRPILMTSATTIIGLLPMSIVEVSGSFISYIGLARGIAGGLILSTICTLVMVPIVYTFIDDLSRVLIRLVKPTSNPAIFPGVASE